MGRGVRVPLEGRALPTVGMSGAGVGCSPPKWGHSDPTESCRDQWQQGMNVFIPDGREG